MYYLSAVVPISEKKIPSNGAVAVEEEKKLAIATTLSHHLLDKCPSHFTKIIAENYC